jgi:hypothetical protein
MGAWFAVAVGAGSLLGVAPLVHAADRYGFVGNGDDVAMFINMDKIVKVGYLATSWFLYVNRDLDRKFGPSGAYTILKVRFDCANDTNTILYSVLYSLDGSNRTFPDQVPTQPNVPDSLMDSGSRVACGQTQIDAGRISKSLDVAVAEGAIILHKKP